MLEERKCLFMKIINEVADATDVWYDLLCGYDIWLLAIYQSEYSLVVKPVPLIRMVICKIAIL